MDNKKTSIFKSRRFKYGSLAIGLTVLLIALIIIFNAAIYAITYSFGWYIDLTSEKYYGITDESTVLLDSVITSDVQITVTFCQDKDLLLGDSQGFYIYKCIESYQKEYPQNIKIQFIDINKHPELVGDYTTQKGIKLYSYNIIMESNKTSSIRVLDYDNFFTYDSESQQIYAFKGELCFTSYIISLCQNMPVCYFTEGHGEAVSDGQGNKSALWEMLEDVGFVVETIDLRKEGATLSGANMVVINAPISDFSLEELAEVDKFVDGNRGNALIFLSPEAMTTTDKGKELTNFKEFLKLWGFEVEGKVIDNTNSLANSDGFDIIADYPIPSEGDFAASLHQYMRSYDSQPYTIVKNALSITCSWENNAEKDTNASKDKNFDTVLYSYNTAKVGNKKGQYSIAALVKKTGYIEEQEVKNYMFVASDGYASADFLRSTVYGNRDIIYMLSDQMGKFVIPVGIDIKPFDSEQLTISNGMAYFWTILLTGVLPMGVIVTGTVICYRRKRS